MHISTTKTFDAKELSIQIEKLREKMNWNRSQVCNYLGISPTLLFKWKAGIAGPIDTYRRVTSVVSESLEKDKPKAKEKKEKSN